MEKILKKLSRKSFLKKLCLGAFSLTALKSLAETREWPNERDDEILANPDAFRPKKSIYDAIAELRATSCENLDDARIDALYAMQEFTDQFPKQAFNKYKFNQNQKEVEELARIFPVIHFLEDAVEKTTNEVRSTPVEKGQVKMWLVYNMGFIVKTADACFSIDLANRRAQDFEPLLDFSLITHNHPDHASQMLMEAMKAKGKPVVSNFFDSPQLTRENAAEYKFGNIEIKTTRVHHSHWRTNKWNKNMPVATFEINCGNAADNCVIYHSGDCADIDELNPVQKVDILMPHFRNGLKTEDLILKKVRPEMAFILHLMELSHATRWGRWSYQVGLRRSGECGAPEKRVLMPIWGEKVEWVRTGKII